MNVLMAIIDYYAILIAHILSPTSDYLRGKKPWYWPALIEWDIMMNTIRLFFTEDMKNRFQKHHDQDPSMIQTINQLKFKIRYLKSLTSK